MRDQDSAVFWLMGLKCTYLSLAQKSLWICQTCLSSSTSPSVRKELSYSSNNLPLGLASYPILHKSEVHFFVLSMPCQSVLANMSPPGSGHCLTFVKSRYICSPQYFATEHKLFSVEVFTYRDAWRQNTNSLSRNNGLLFSLNTVAPTQSKRKNLAPHCPKSSLKHKYGNDDKASIDSLPNRHFYDCWAWSYIFRLPCFLDETAARTTTKVGKKSRSQFNKSLSHEQRNWKD